MTFGEKIVKLRKEKGLSQEALAEQLNTTRQAISKWENDQGYPETEKLLLLGNIFDVSVDCLLKDELSEDKQENGTYYVSKELAQSWLWHENTTTRKLRLGLIFLLSARLPFLLMPNHHSVRLILSIILGLSGFGIILWMCLNDSNYEYRLLKRSSLIFDKQFLAELKNKYVVMKKRYLCRIIISIAVIILGGAGLTLHGVMSDLVWTVYNVLYTMLLPVSIGTMVNSLVMIDAYALFVFNEEHMRKLSTRFLNKLRCKIDSWLEK